MIRILAAAVASAVTLTAFAGLPAQAESEGFATLADSQIVEKRRKPRIKGGSGCDDPRDVIEHPECR